MATIAESQQQIDEAKRQAAQARTNLQNEKQKVEEFDKQAKSIKVPRRSLLYQQQNKDFMSSGRSERYFQEVKTKKKEAIAQAQSAKQEISSYETNVLNPYEQKIGQAEVEISKAKYGYSNNSDYTTAQKYVDRGKIPIGENKNVMKYYKQIKEGRESQQKYFEYKKELNNLGLTPMYNQKGEVIGYEDKVAGMSYEASKLPSVLQQYRPGDINKFENAGIIRVDKSPQISNTELTLKEVIMQQTLIPEAKQFNLPSPTKYTGIFGTAKVYYSKANTYISDKIINPVGGFINKKTGLTTEKFSESYADVLSAATSSQDFILPTKLKEQKKQLIKGAVSGVITDVKDKPLSQAVLFGAGGLLGTGTKVIGKSVTILEATKAAKYFPFKSVVEGGAIALGGTLGGIYAVDVGTKAYSYKGNMFDIGLLAGKESKNLLLLGYGTKLGVSGYNKGSDIIRTWTGTEVPEKSIVAPEFFAGQKYPEIKKGETAGELMSEFYNPVKEIGEEGRSPRMFTASPSTFPKSTTVQGGSSELPGLYGSSRLSATFLKVQDQSYSKFGLKGIFDISEPTALRTELSGLELAPGVKSKQKSLTRLDNNLIKFYKGNDAKKGTAYIPFIKTEKEAILTVGSDIKVYDSNYFLKFKGRRVPIFKATTNKGEALAVERATGKKSMSIAEYSSSYGRSSKYPIINPLSSIVYYSRPRKSSSRYYNNMSHLSSVQRSSQYSARSLIYGRSKSRPSGSKVPSYKYSPVDYTFYSLSKSKRDYPGLYPITYPSISYYYNKPNKDKGFTFIPRIAGGGGINKISKGRLPSLTKYTPSFAALVLKIKSKKKPYEVGGKNTYFAGFRPIIE